MASKKEIQNAPEQLGAQVTKVEVSTVERRQELSKPTQDFSVNELVVSNLVRGLEMAIAEKDAEKVLGDSSLLIKSKGKTLVFTADIMSFHGDLIDLGYVSVVGEKVGSVLTHTKESISNLVAEKFTTKLSDINFQSLSGKLLRGTTLMFTAKVVIELGIVTLENLTVEDFGFRLLKEDRTVDTLAIFNDLVDTYNYEYYTVESGILLKNLYRNTSLDSYFEAFKTSEDQKPLEEALKYILGSYDDKYKKMKTVLWGIINPKN